MLNIFKAGLYVANYKNTCNCPIQPFPAPSTVAIPMHMHKGVSTVPFVKKGDYVKKGQVIGNFENDLSCPIHASVSGIVTDIEIRSTNICNRKNTYIIIENDFTDTLDETVIPYKGDPSQASSAEITNLICKAGIYGLDGTTLPICEKIKHAAGKVTELIINCVECEPYVTAKHRIMTDETEFLIKGAELLMRATQAKHMTIATASTKPNAVKHMTDYIKSHSCADIRVVKAKYPQGNDSHLIYTLKGVKTSVEKHPSDTGYAVFNAETCIAVYHAVYNGMPLTSTDITVDGNAIIKPCNYRVPIGTSIGDIISNCGATDDMCKIIIGNPMNGTAQWDINEVITKGTSALLAFSENTSDNTQGECIHCGKCIEVCPMHLMPIYLAAFSKLSDNEKLKKFDIMSCIECGNCSYICPANVPIVQYIKTSKNLILAATGETSNENAAKERKL